MLKLKNVIMITPLLFGSLMAVGCSAVNLVRNIEVEHITINKQELNLLVNGSDTLMAVTTPHNVTNRNVFWSSSVPKIATVINGIVTAHKVGSTTIWAKTESGNKTASCMVNVTKTIAAPMITNTYLLSGAINSYYHQTLNANGTDPMIWSITNGSLPNGLNLDPKGIISGIPVDESKSLFTVNVKNDGGNSAKRFSITIEKQAPIVNTIYATVNNIKLEIVLTRNSSVNALIAILKQNDIIYQANDYGNFEKVGDIGYVLPTNDVQMNTTPGDVVLYGTSIVMFYGTNSWSYTSIGRINGYSQNELRNLLGAGLGTTTIKLSLI